MVTVTNTHKITQMSEKMSLLPSGQATAPESNPTPSGQPKFRRKLSSDVLRQASSGPTPVRNKSINPMGIFTLLKKGAPTLIFEPSTHSDRTGKSVPESTATQATSRIRLLNKKLDSRETMESSWFSLCK